MKGSVWRQILAIFRPVIAVTQHARNACMIDTLAATLRDGMLECNIIYTPHTWKYIVTAYKTYVYIHAVRLTTCRYSVCYANTSCARCSCQDDYQILAIFGMCTLPRMFGHISVWGFLWCVVTCARLTVMQICVSTCNFVPDFGILEVNMTRLKQKINVLWIVILYQMSDLLVTRFSWRTNGSARGQHLNHICGVLLLEEEQ